MSFGKLPFPAPDGERPVPDLSALDAALRDVIAAARSAPQTAPQPAHEAPLDQPGEESGDLQATLQAVSRAATTIDQLVERNRAVTDAAVRSVEFFRQEAEQARAEADQLRAEMEAMREENEALKAAALAHAEELELELAARTHELAAAQAWIADIRTHVETLLGNVETRLAETKIADFIHEK